MVCQQGLKFFTEKLVALREMQRVLMPRGRLALSVWGPIDDHPYFLALAADLEWHISPQAAGPLRAPFALGNADEVRRLLAASGFGQIAMRTLTKTVHCPPAEEFVSQHVAGTPAAAAVAHVDESRRAAVVSAVSTAMQVYADATGFEMQQQVHIVLAQP